MWVPPPVTLRPLGIGERIDASFKIWTRNFLAMAKAMLVIAVPAGVVEAIVTLSSQPSTTTTQIGSQTFTTTTASGTSALGGTAVNALIGIIVGALSVTTLYGIIGSAYLGQPVSWREALRRGARRMLSAVWISFLSGLVVLLPILVVALLVVLLVGAGVHGGAILIGVLLGLAAVVYVVWFEVCAHLATPVMMLEGVRGAAAIRRAIRLVRGSWWSVFTSLFLMGLIVGVASAVLGGIFGAVLLAGHGASVTSAVANFVLRTVVLVVLTPLSASLAVVLVIDMRVRKEGFDIQVLASSMGVAPGPEALSFIRPQSGYGPGGPAGGHGPPGQAPPYGQAPTYPPPTEPTAPAPQVPIPPFTIPGQLPPRPIPSMPPPPPPAPSDPPSSAPADGPPADPPPAMPSDPSH